MIINCLVCPLNAVDMEMRGVFWRLNIRFNFIEFCGLTDQLFYLKSGNYLSIYGCDYWCFRSDFADYWEFDKLCATLRLILRFYMSIMILWAIESMNCIKVKSKINEHCVSFL
ncbi:hypothetical protein ACKWTF_012850 [Chironomus riparius]